MTVEEVYEKWRAGLKEPDDSVFYYHKSLDRILLGLAIFVFASRPIVSKLGKAEMLSIFHRQVPDLITAWIDEDGKAFEVLFPIVMTVAQGYNLAARGAEREWPARKKEIRMMAYLFCNGCGIGGDMTDEVADTLLDDLTTDGRQIESEKIKRYAERLLFLTKRHGVDIPMPEMVSLMNTSV